MKKILAAVIVVIACFAGCVAAGPRPPIELPFAVHQAGATVSTELHITKDREFPFYLKFIYNQKDSADQERVRKLVGSGRHTIDGIYIDGIPILLKITVSIIDSSGERILLEKEFLTMGQTGHGINYFDRKIGYMHLPQGRCRVKVQCLKVIPELSDTKVILGIYLSERGKV
jgi:hypothetical protein